LPARALLAIGWVGTKGPEAATARWLARFIGNRLGAEFGTLTPFEVEMTLVHRRALRSQAA